MNYKLDPLTSNDLSIHLLPPDKSNNPDSDENIDDQGIKDSRFSITKNPLYFWNKTKSTLTITSTSEIIPHLPGVLELQKKPS